MLKLASECIKSIIWNGGLHELAIECGYLKGVTQLHDIHNLLLGVHEGVLNNATKSHPDARNSIDYTNFISIAKADDSNDQISSFWVTILNYLNAYVCYYFAIRIGNFALRNACLLKLAELFFAYNHSNYQTLVCEHIADLHK